MFCFISVRSDSWHFRLYTQLFVACAPIAILRLGAGLAVGVLGSGQAARVSPMTALRS
jgi:hypothetical protein